MTLQLLLLLLNSHQVSGNIIIDLGSKHYAELSIGGLGDCQGYLMEKRYQGNQIFHRRIDTFDCPDQEEMLPISITENDE